MGTFICDKCRTCGKFPFCNVTESKDGDCGTYVKRKLYTINADGTMTIHSVERKCK